MGSSVRKLYWSFLFCQDIAFLFCQDIAVAVASPENGIQQIRKRRTLAVVCSFVYSGSLLHLVLPFLACIGRGDCVKHWLFSCCLYERAHPSYLARFSRSPWVPND